MATEFSGEYRIPATPQEVWAALNDVETLKGCIPGCKALEKTSDTEFVSTVAAKVGPVSATFKGSVTLSDLDPPRGYTISGQGQGGAAGFAKLSARVSLAEEAGGTLLRYEARADIGGKLASVGSRLIQTVAKKNADDFFSALSLKLGGSGEAEPAPAAAPAPGTAAREETAGKPASAPGAGLSLPPWLGWAVSAVLGALLLNCWLR